MKQLMLFSLISLLIFFLASCEGEVVGYGYVYDSFTKTPIDNVLVRYYTKKKKRHFEKEMFTDADGYFSIGSFEGCVPDCPDAVIELIKDGYRTVEVINPKGDTIYLQP